MRNFAGILVTLMVLTFPSVGIGGAGTVLAPTFTETDETVATIGLRLEFGDIIKPSVVGTIRRTTTDTSNDVTGALAEIAVPINPESGALPVVRLMGIFGNTDVQGLAGVGFDFGNNQGILGLGVQGENIDGGVNFGLDGIFLPYIGVSTYDGPPNRRNDGPTNIPNP